jgi:hypothetical protein
MDNIIIKMSDILGYYNRIISKDILLYPSLVSFGIQGRLGSPQFGMY